MTTVYTERDGSIRIAPTHREWGNPLADHAVCAVVESIEGLTSMVKCAELQASAMSDSEIWWEAPKLLEGALILKSAAVALASGVTVWGNGQVDLALEDFYEQFAYLTDFLSDYIHP
jgi:hypothetical protein